ncbi:MAG TPA: hypothetical protein VEG68_19920 [Terriglobales bacterium]|nr:hypothetical protein [Terriglobales bacterium]
MASNVSRFRRWAKRLVGASTVSRATVITIETARVSVIQRRQSTRLWCRECGRVVDMVGLTQAAVLVGSSQPLLRDAAESHGWHLTEDQCGSPLICLDSLLDAK